MIWYANDLPYGPRPIGARAHVVWAPGPRALPCWANTSPKNAPWKKESKLCFLVVFWKQKRCATSVRSFWRRYRAEISDMCQKTKDSVFMAEAHLLKTFRGLRPCIISSADTKQTWPSVLTLSFYTCLSFQESTVHSVFWLQFRSPIVFSHQFSAQSTFFCKNLKQCFNCCSNNCFLFVQRAREAASPGGSWPVNRHLFESGRALFLKHLLEPIFSYKNHIFGRK